MGGERESGTGRGRVEREEGEWNGRAGGETGTG